MNTSKKTGSKPVQRYEWQDALVEAQAMGVITNGLLMTANKLAHAIHWVPSDGSHSELRWSDQEALEVVGMARSAFYDNVPLLEEAGYMIKKGGNWCPVIPDSHSGIREAFIERRDAIKAKYRDKKAAANSSRRKSGSRTSKSGSHTPESESRTPESENQTHTLSTNNTVDLSPVNVSNEKAVPVSDEPVTQLEETKVRGKDDSLPSLNSSLPLASPSLPNFEDDANPVLSNLEAKTTGKYESRTFVDRSEEAVAERIAGIGRGRNTNTATMEMDW